MSEHTRPGPKRTGPRAIYRGERMVASPKSMPGARLRSPDPLADGQP
ncbi:hypothetical protein FTUN_6453 [Frigoriglobus tundricola]|uniref:Uncharacterized protein n=1 Tax=Frigoriglobus tundricola TaxID=2774151 RepID=A0A6M5YYB6_9BACT|nr:hypothetical protein FTUN_6453 [Frigoriglobus tundricola]